MKTLLKNVLVINALSSGATGIGLVVLNGPIANLFEVENTVPFIGVGIFLILFALYVYLESRKAPHQSGQVRLIIALDIIWVGMSLALVLFQLFQLSTTGYILIIAVAVWVALMAFLQIKGLKEIQATTV